MKRLVKPKTKKRKENKYGQPVIGIRELSKYLANRAGVHPDDVKEVLLRLPEIIIELVVQKNCVNIRGLGTFYLRTLYMPSYSMKKQESTGYKTRCSFTFKKSKTISKMINELMHELYPEEFEEDIEDNG